MIIRARVPLSSYSARLLNKTRQTKMVRFAEMESRLDHDDRGCGMFGFNIGHTTTEKNGLLSILLDKA